jgi:F-type H+-transporting ATPase subunit a
VSEGHSPLTQFVVTPIIELPQLFGVNIDFTNASLFMVLAVMAAGALFWLAMRRQHIIPGRLQGLAEVCYEFVFEIVEENMGDKAKKFAPYIFSLFLFILFCNLLGMLPFSFTATSHVIVTFGLAAIVFISVTLIALLHQGPIKFFKHFVPEGLPIAIIPLVFMIEFISFLSRPVSLSIRLAANMMAGHTLLKVIAAFVVPLGLLGIAPVAFLTLLTGFEIFVAILQAYIFTLLTAMYLGEAVEDSH